jgi:hypothetical protein
MTLRFGAPARGFASAIALVLMCAGVASAQPRKKAPVKPAPAPLTADKTDGAPAAAPATKTETKKAGTKEQNFNFDNLNLNGKSRTPQLLYFLERANEELERASLEKRSFIPHMVRSLEEEQL